ncbi:MAG: phenylalanine--tRNA ligase subunit beta [Vicingaceae bacterium]
MKISYSWLNNYLSETISLEKITNTLTEIGLEVEEVTTFQPVKGMLKGVVTGEVLEKIKHPNADKLSCVKINIGEKVLDIVCGAPNIDKGQKVMVATVGTVLYPENKKEGFKISKSKIRGEVSEGMVCSEKELGISENHEGIMVLPNDTPIGIPASDYFNLKEDYVIEIGLTPNRSDAMSHYGVARDLVAALKFRGEKIDLKLPDVNEQLFEKNKEKYPVEVLDVEKCPRYAGVLVKDVKVASSPEWLQQKLKAIGLHPINNVVDVTNYVLHELGQPLHAFDADKIKGNKVIVKTLPDNTPFVTLDAEERKLSADDLMICNEQEPMCIAGVFGGLHSGITNESKAVFLESAYFNPRSIRKTAKRHGLNTDASFRFERGVDPNKVIFALKRAAQLICEIAGGNIASAITDVYPQPIENFKVDFSIKKCNDLLGIDIPKEKLLNILDLLAIKVLKDQGDELTLEVPLYRNDVTRQADVVEEILRIYGYDNVHFGSTLNSSLSFQKGINENNLNQLVSSQLNALGFNEVFNNSLTKSAYYQNNEQIVKIINPLSNELDVLRASMIYGMLENTNYNINRKQSDLKLFEWGNTYWKEQENYLQQHNLSLLISGRLAKESWNTNDDEGDFYYLKGIAFQIIEKTGIKIDQLLEETFKNEVFEYGITYKLGEKIIFELGKVNPELTKQFDVNKPVFYAQFNWDNVIKNAAKIKIKYEPVSKFPSVRRDLALLIDKQVTFEALKNIAQKKGGKILKAVNLFDVYEGDKIEPGKKSYALSFLFVDNQKTLTDKQIEKLMDQLIQSFKTELGATIR